MRAAQQGMTMPAGDMLELVPDNAILKARNWSFILNTV